MKQPVLARIDAELNGLAGSTTQIAGEPGKLPAAKHQLEVAENGASGHQTIDGWAVGTGAAKRTYSLSMILGALRPSTASPIEHLDDLLQMRLSAIHAAPAPVLVSDFEGGFKSGTETEERTTLGPCPEELPLVDRVEHRELRHGSVVIDTRFQFAEVGGAFAKTFPLGRWVETQITGLTSQPIVLRGFFSQTFEPGHHNFFEHFLFEPALEPGISPAILQEREDRDIRQLVVMDSSGTGEQNASFFKLGAAGRYEPLP
jgi:hypothetical protein